MAITTDQETQQAQEALVPALVSMSRALYGRGWMEGTSGNLSARPSADKNLTLVTASGRSKGELTDEDIVTVEVSTSKPLRTGGPRPSAETAIHTALYRSAPGCEAVIHAHAPHATAVASLAARRGETSVRISDFELIKGFGLADPTSVTVPVFPNWPDVPRIGSDVEAHYSAFAETAAGGTPAADAPPPVLLIAHHGATVWGPTLEAARNRLECLEGICELLLLTT
ncbi:methylthioribulose 1-phosphate dehydratase [Streptomyces sp. NBC_01142]|uniref:methylthioribulose 1-phosphate dehydratase n=1 Tax=Streptomyces sp. NBC_01142 TaxID=2975865 RepID=UPI0022548FB8|nr:methylthioribulose 1-phosphate dehydratase [Streptomyces sp. NBC_01142]MCX4823158.1 methylthioribulose 1-phosphate dehydratase [Streptomyces sp. NBC_01142]